MHGASANSTAESTPARHVRRAARTLGPTRHQRTQSATPPAAANTPSSSDPHPRPSARRSTVSGDTMHCPICGVMAPGLAALNMHLDEAHFTGGAAESQEVGAGSGQRPAAMRDDLGDVGGAILGFFRGAGRAVAGQKTQGTQGTQGNATTEQPVREPADLWHTARTLPATAQPPGASRQHTAYFSRLRTLHTERTLLEGNRAENRLEKLSLVHAQYQGHSARHLQLQLQLQKAEQAVVAWQPDSLAQCAQCSRALRKGLLARRHHCRVCGKLLCARAECSDMLTLPLPVSGQQQPTAGLFSAERTAQVRACAECLRTVRLVQERVRRQRDRLQGPLEIERLYLVTRQAIKLVDRVLPVFNSLVIRLAPHNNSPDTALLARAARMRNQLTEAFGSLDAASREIAKAPAESPGDARVRSAIRAAVVQYLQINMFSLTMLPRVDRRGAGVKRGDEMETASVGVSSVGTPVSEPPGALSEPTPPLAPPEERSLFSSSPEPPPASSAQQQPVGLARSLLSYIVPRRVDDSAATEGDDLIRRALTSDPGREARIASMPQDEKLASLDVLRDQRQRVLGYIAEAQRDRRLEDAWSLQASLADLNIELSLIERNL
ncbi:carboxypeptidase Y-deficient [Coemansia sp. RSA 2603]|nr:carboxypeptidase Y-deficient [Coemansia sp. RSA 2603]